MLKSIVFDGNSMFFYVTKNMSAPVTFFYAAKTACFHFAYSSRKNLTCHLKLYRTAPGLTNGKRKCTIIDDFSGVPKKLRNGGFMEPPNQQSDLKHSNMGSQMSQAKKMNFGSSCYGEIWKKCVFKNVTKLKFHRVMCLF